MCDRGDERLQEVIGQLRQPVIHPQSIPAAVDEPGAPQIRQVPGGGRLGNAQPIQFRGTEV